MISGTVLAIFLVPVFFVVVRGIFKRPVTRGHAAVPVPEPAPVGHEM